MDFIQSPICKNHVLPLHYLPFSGIFVIYPQLSRISIHCRCEYSFTYFGGIKTITTLILINNLQHRGIAPCFLRLWRACHLTLMLHWLCARILYILKFRAFQGDAVTQTHFYMLGSVHSPDLPCGAFRWPMRTRTSIAGTKIPCLAIRR